MPVAVLAAVFLAAGMGDRSPERLPSGDVRGSARDGAPQLERRTNPVPAAPAGAPRDANGLHRHLLSLDEAHRNQTLLMSLRDAGVECSDVLGSARIGGAWHADCGGTLLYSVRIDEFGAVSIVPVPHGDFERGIYFIE